MHVIENMHSLPVQPMAGSKCMASVIRISAYFALSALVKVILRCIM